MRRSGPMLVLSLLCAGPLAAQAPPSPMTRGLSGATLTFQLPSYEGDASAMMLDVGYRARVGSTLMAVAELPLIRASADGAPGSGDIMLGNPWLGLRRVGAHSMFELGVRVPVVNDDPESELPTIAGLFGDFERLEAYVPDLTTLRLRGTFFSEPPAGTGVTWQGHVGPAFMIPGNDADPELFADYGLFIGYLTPAVHLQGGLSGRWLVTSDGGDFSDESLNQITFSATWRLGRVRPTAFLRLPMDDDLQEVYTYTFGVGLVIGGR